MRPHRPFLNAKALAVRAKGRTERKSAALLFELQDFIALS
jgi:hypothetical protein